MTVVSSSHGEFRALAHDCREYSRNKVKVWRLIKDHSAAVKISFTWRCPLNQSSTSLIYS